jgi:hypothetical protein
MQAKFHKICGFAVHGSAEMQKCERSDAEPCQKFVPVLHVMRACRKAVAVLDKI